MPKPPLEEPYASLERQIITTLCAGLKEWRADLDYPESYSDFMACVRAAMRRFDIQMRPVDIDLPIKYDVCAKCGENIIGAGSYVVGTSRHGAHFHMNDICFPPDARRAFGFIVP